MIAFIFDSGLFPWEDHVSVDEAEIFEDIHADGNANMLPNPIIIDDDDFQANGMGTGNDLLIQQQLPASESIRHNDRKKKLVTHFKVALSKDEVVWPRQNRATRLYDPLLRG